MIINTGNRTDIPAFYSQWFFNRVKAGQVLVRNPYNPQQVMRYLLDPQLVDCLCFCTKNPEPMIKRLEELRAFRQLWFVTITPYGREIEPHVPEKKQVMETFKALSEIVGKHAIIWRYDPIFISPQYPVEFHCEIFTQMAEELRGYTDTCVISFLDQYAKTKRNFPEGKEVSQSQREILCESFAKIGHRLGLRIKTCCEGNRWEKYGIDTSGCMTKAVVERVLGMPLDMMGNLPRARKECDCLLGNDIGAYNTCGHGCLYCYANYDKKTVARNSMRHDPMSPFLLGGHESYDEIKDARQSSFCSGQQQLEIALV